MTGEKKWVVITGATSGLGEHTAKRLLDTGYHAVVTGRNKERLRETFAPYGGRAFLLPYDMSDLDGIEPFAAQVFAEVGPIDGLVIAAGVSKVMPMSLIKKPVLESVFGINTFAGMMLTSSLTKKGRMKNGGSVILFSSLSAHEGAKGQTVYAASKGAIEGFVQTAAAELSDKGIRINAIAPGMVLTRMTETFLAQLSEEQRKRIEDGYPLGLGQPGQISGTIEYLLSEAGKWTTGRTFILDGGRLSRE
ncbi:MAG: SDR family oxidoreductase [Clostridiales Family XIII bacterium]|jgi:NAD(P)-dependent dehydrogenase (short-subunit alcohol dehydrogenase family)|nr:SDR family oxidoreductase [Clostridiales Family XIII bacterium]